MCIRDSSGAAPRGPVRLGGAGCGRGPDLSVTAARRTRAYRHLREQLRGGRRAEPLRSRLRLAGVHLRPSELLLLGPAEDGAREPHLAAVGPGGRGRSLPLGRESRGALPHVGEGRGEPPDLPVPRPSPYAGGVLDLRLQALELAAHFRATPAG